MATINAWGSAKPAQESFGGTNQSTYTTGDILYASASNTLSKLAIGSTGNVLQVTGGIPAWGSVPGGTSPWVFLQQKTAASLDAAVTFDSTVMTTTYPIYMFVFDSVYPTASSDFLALLSSNNGSSYVTSGYKSNANGNTSTVEFLIYKSIFGPASSTITNNFSIGYLSNLTTNSNVFYPTFFGNGTFNSTGATNVLSQWSGCLLANAVYNNIQFTFLSTTWNQGKISLYGLKTS